MVFAPGFGLVFVDLGMTMVYDVDVRGGGNKDEFGVLEASLSGRPVDDANGRQSQILDVMSFPKSAAVQCQDRLMVGAV